MPSTAARAWTGFLCTLLLFSSCIAFRRSPGVSLSSEPPGASVYVDGADTGFVTPCEIALSRGDRHRIELMLPGYEVATRMVDPGTRWHLVYWRDADYWPRRFAHPLGLPFHEFWVPLRRDSSLQPSRIYVALRLEGE